jgi:hypothetical protein
MNYKIINDKVVLKKEGVNFALTGEQVDELVLLLNSWDVLSFYRQPTHPPKRK